MKVVVRLFATLGQYLPDEGDGESATLDLPEGSRVEDLVRALGIPGDMPFLTVVNGRDAEADQPLSDGDVVSLFPPLAGG